MAKQFISHTSLFEAMTCSIILVDQMLVVQYMNPAAENLTGHSLTQSKNKKLTRIIYAKSLYKHTQKAINFQQSHVTREGKICLFDGQEITVDCTVTPLFENNQAIGALLELNQVDRQLRITRDKQIVAQQQTNQAVLKGLAHEIKNPLGGIRGAAQLLELENSELKEYTQIIISESDRLKALIDRMLGSSSLPKMSKINILEVMEHVRFLLENGKPAGITIHIDYDPSIPEITGDRDQLVQVILNIANNAINALGNTGDITFKTRIERRFTINQNIYPLVLRASIIDNGKGIPKALQDKIFFPMISGNDEGTGLGLSIAQSLIGRHSGLIEFECSEGRTEFSVYIPIT